MKQYLRSIFYILLGSFIGGLPLILLYILGGTFLPFFAIFLVIGGYVGSQFAKTPRDYKTLFLIVAISFLLLSLLLWFGLPFMTLFHDHFPLTFSNLFLYFEDHDFLIEIIRNFLFSIFFMLIGWGMVFLLLKDDDVNSDEDEKKI